MYRVTFPSSNIKVFLPKSLHCNKEATKKNSKEALLVLFYAFFTGYA